jgi:putative N6-adenine-specific DNA methylase
MRLFATASKGTEPALRDELRELRFHHVRADRGGVHFEGDIFEGARACLWSRVAVRVLVELTAFDARSDSELYDGMRTIDWSEWLTPRTTLAVRASCRASRLVNSQYVLQKTKDAIVDTLRDRLGERPSVDKNDPDVLVFVHLVRDRATAYLDIGGASLHERGWRGRGGEAPLRETVAASVVRLSGWDRQTPLLDPMCGAGTIAIEAAAWAQRRAPGLARPRFGCERWAHPDTTLRLRLSELRDNARAAFDKQGPTVVARDIDPLAIERTRANARAAGVDICVELGDVRTMKPDPHPRFVVSNPPYGERLDAASELYSAIVRAFERCPRTTVALLAGNPAIARAWPRPPDRYWMLFNGAIECRLLLYEPRAASRGHEQ